MRDEQEVKLHLLLPPGINHADMKNINEQLRMRSGHGAAGPYLQLLCYAP
jgi:hypothetical protein